MQEQESFQLPVEYRGKYAVEPTGAYTLTGRRCFSVFCGRCDAVLAENHFDPEYCIRMHEQVCPIPY